MQALRSITFGLALASASPSLALRQDKAQTAIFPTTTRLVLVDFVVTDKSGRAMGGLKAQDFVVTEDGKARPIVSFAAFSSEPPADSARAAVPVEGIPQAVIPGVEDNAATTLVLVDDAQLTPQDAPRIGPALKRLVDIIGEQKGYLALVAPGSGVEMAHDAASNRETFRAAIDKIAGYRVHDSSPYPLSDVEAILGEQGDTSIIERLANRFVYLNRGLLKYDMALIAARGRVVEVAATAKIRRKSAYEVLLKGLAWLAGEPGRHSVVMVSSGYASDPGDVKQQEVVTRSLKANAPIHFLDARGLQGMSRYLGVEYRQALEYDALEPPLSFSEAAAGASGLAADTGGLYIRNSNDMIKGISRIMDMTATYYVLGYEPPEHTKRGFRKIKVEAATKGLKVVARRGYFDELVTAR